MASRSKQLLTPEQFEAAVAKGGTMQEHTIRLARRMLVDGIPTSTAAQEADVKPPQASTLKRRILELHLAAQAVKVSAEQFMLQQPPRNVRLAALRPELVKLQRAGYTLAQLVEFLAVNDIEATSEEITAILAESKA
jgi:hypothetical protein